MQDMLTSNIHSFIFRIILATDMSNHNQVLNKFKSILEEFDLNNTEHRILVAKLFFSLNSIYIVKNYT